MLVSFSFYDVLKIPDIARVASNQFELLKREMDSVVAPYLFILGGNIDSGIKIQACKHRTSDLKDVVGYRYVLLERADKEWMSSPYCSMDARIHAQKDPELASDMVRMSAQGGNDSSFRAMCVGAMGKEGTTRNLKNDESETWQEDLQHIIVLQEIQKEVRSYMHQDEYTIEPTEYTFNNEANNEGENNE